MSNQDTQKLVEQLPDEPTEHFCIAPFQSIRQNPHGKNSPCAFGAGEWNHRNLNTVERWHADEVNDLRKEFIAGKRPKACHRCWAEEDAGKQSLRQRQYEYFPDDYQDFVKSGRWVHGPKTAVFKTSNICNLACRSCGGWDTNTYMKEGMHYADEYDTKIKHPTTGKMVHWNRFIPIQTPKHIDFMDYVKIADNLEKIDFFGGEPLLNTTQLPFLEYLADTGKSKNTTLFYSTNGTNLPTDRLKRAWSKFKRVELSISCDGIDEEFEYLRYPGKFDVLQNTIRDLKSFQSNTDNDIYMMAGLTISNMNVLTADRTREWLESNIGDVYITMVQSPDYQSISRAPEYVKSHIKSTVKMSDILGYVNVDQTNIDAWRQFIIWMKRQDKYRQQSFDKTFPDMYNLIQDDWHMINDLSEQNFNKKEQT